MLCLISELNAIDRHHRRRRCFFFYWKRTKKTKWMKEEKKITSNPKTFRMKTTSYQTIYCLLNVSFFSLPLSLLRFGYIVGFFLSSFGKLSLSSTTNRIDESILGDNNLNVCHWNSKKKKNKKNEWNTKWKKQITTCIEEQSRNENNKIEYLWYKII